MAIDHTQQSPFIIWTFRRTGGTNLGDALFQQSAFDCVQHEPFNADRIFGGVTRDWLAKKDESALRTALSDICGRKVLMKHCLEIIPEAINRELAEISTRAGYRHLFLYRRRPLDRLLSLHFALKSGAWGKAHVKKAEINDDIFQDPLPINDLIDHEALCRKMMRDVFEQLCKLGARPLVVTFEDLFANKDGMEARRRLKAVLSALGLSQGEGKDDAFLKRVLSRGDQGTRDNYKRFVGYRKLTQALAKLGEFKLQKKPPFSISYPDEMPFTVMKCVVWGPQPDVQANTFVVSGAVVLKPDAPTDCRLLINNGNDCREVLWGLPSPKLAKEYPDNPRAAGARFLAADRVINRDLPMRLLLVFPSGDSREIAKVEMQ